MGAFWRMQLELYFEHSHTDFVQPGPKVHAMKHTSLAFFTFSRSDLFSASSRTILWDTDAEGGARTPQNAKNFIFWQFPEKENSFS